MFTEGTYDPDPLEQHPLCVHAYTHSKSLNSNTLNS